MAVCRCEQSQLPQEKRRWRQDWRHPGRLVCLQCAYDWRSKAQYPYPKATKEQIAFFDYQENPHLYVGPNALKPPKVPSN